MGKKDFEKLSGMVKEKEKDQPSVGYFGSAAYDVSSAGAREFDEMMGSFKGK